MKKSALGKGLDAILGEAQAPPLRARGSEPATDAPAPKAKNKEDAAAPLKAVPDPAEEIPETTGKTAAPAASAPAPAGESAAGTALEVSIEALVAGRGQPRRHFEEKALQELADSIQENGILQPLIVTPNGGGYEIIAGERRLRAAVLAGLSTVPVVIKRDVEDAAMVELSLIENIQREELTPLEEARAYQRLCEEYGHTQTDVARKVGKSRAAVTNSIRLLALPESLKQAVEGGKLTEGHARALLALPTAAAQVEAARQIMNRGLSVRETEELVRRGGGRRAPVGKKKAAVDSAFAEIEKTLETALGTKVRMRAKGKGGCIEIEYFSNDELDRLLARLGGS